MRRFRVALLAMAGVAMIVVGGGVAFALLSGGDEPPPPQLERGGVVANQRGVPWRVGAGSFAGYRVDEDYLGVGVHTAVGRTRAVSGEIRVTGTTIATARVEADLTQLRSDQGRRDDALRTRGIETGRFPRASFSFDGGLDLAGGKQGADGTLHLHGRTAPVSVTVDGSLSHKRLELVGRTRIEFRTFAIEPPSVAGLVTVHSTGILEFRLVATPGQPG